MTYANPANRLGAFLIDTVILSMATVPVVFLTVGTSIFSVINASDTSMSDEEAMLMIFGMFGKLFALSLLFVILMWLYYALQESGKHQATIGKRALKIKVTDDQGNRITFLRATGRHFGKMISGTIMYIGYIMILFTDKKQGLHDMMASTLVLEAGEEYQNFEEDAEEF